MKAITLAVLAATFVIATPAVWAQQAPSSVPAPSTSSEPLTDAKKANIKKLLELTGVRAIPEQIANSTVQNMSGGIRQLDPKFPDRGFIVMRDAILSGLNAKVDSSGGLLDQVTQVYHSNFTANEIAEIIKFYESPAGKKVIGQQGKVNSETFQVAMRWADSMGAELDQRMEAALKKENIKLPDPPKQDAAPKTAPRAPAKEAPKK